MMDDTEKIDAIGQMLIGQFMLHEIQHHELLGQDVSLTPIAHGLIDIYKCLHQGEFGVGHIIDHAEGFRQRLYQDLLTGWTERVECREPLIENVSAEGQILRINLRPLKRLYGDNAAAAADDLALICIKSARITKGRRERFFETLDLFQMLNQAGEIVLGGTAFIFPQDRVASFLFEIRRLMRDIGHVPVFSHSELYRQLNRPSYRVVERSILAASPIADFIEPL